MGIDTRTSDIRATVRPFMAYYRLGSNDPYYSGVVGAYAPNNLGEVGTITSVRGPKPKGRLRFRPNPCLVVKQTGKMLWGENLHKQTALSISRLRPICCEYFAPNYRTTVEGNPAASLYNLMGTVSYKPAWDNGLAALSVQRAYADIHATPMQGLVDLYELKMTFDLLKSPLKFILSSVAVFGKKRKRRKRPKPTLTDAVRKTKDAADNLASAWLQYVYGWIPLGYTIEAAIDALVVKMHNAPSKRARARTTPIMQVGSKSAAMQFGEFNLVFQVETTEWRRATTTLCTQLTYGNWRQYTGTRVDDIPLALWEIIPYSFVADWFVNIGDWINSCVADAGIVRSSSTTCIWVRETVVTLVSATHNTGKKVEFLPCSYTHTARTMERRVNEKLSKTPLLNERFLNLYRKISSVALVWQNLSNAFRKSQNVPPLRKKRKPIPFAKHKGLVS